VHEFTLAKEILSIVHEAARQHRLAALAEVILKVGSQSGVNESSLQFAWEYLRGGDQLTHEAELIIESIPAQGSCLACGYTGPPAGWSWLCPACGAATLRLTQGEEFIVAGVSGCELACVPIAEEGPQCV
jgi:hydrogenase nickel incorporation protein HypA/HybF